MSAPTPSEAVRVAVQTLRDEMLKIADKIEGNHIISGSPGPLFNMGWYAANGMAAGMLRTAVAEDALAALSLHVGDAAIDVEAMLKACVPGGDHCDPQQVADALRVYLGASALPTALYAPALRASAPIAGAGGESDPAQALLTTAWRRVQAWAHQASTQEERDRLNASLDAELKELAADAARYRSLRANCNLSFDRHETVQLVVMHIEFEGLAESFGIEGAVDRYVDQAMRSRP